MENYIVINGKKAELTPEQLKALGIEVEKPNPFKRELRNGEVAYYIADIGDLGTIYNANSSFAELAYSVANFCTDRTLMQQRAQHEILNRLLWRYSMEHDGDKIDWTNHNSSKSYIIYEHDIKGFIVKNNQYFQNLGVVYFHTKETAENAIEEIIEPFMKAHPDFKF